MRKQKRRPKQKPRRKKAQKIIQLDRHELEAILQRAEAELNQEDYATIKAVCESYAYVTGLVEDKATTIARLRKLLFGSSSEKTRDVIEPKQDDADTSQDTDDPTPSDDLSACNLSACNLSACNAQVDAQVDAQAGPEKEQDVSKRKGHGRNGADAYTGAEKVRVPHGTLQSGDPCPDCKKGKVYEVAQPGVLVRMVGQAPVQAKVYELQKLRCNLCGKVFTAEAPEGVGTEKYDATSASMIALLKYGSGLPFNRLDGLQGNLGIPLAASTQWDIVRDSAKAIEPVYNELIRQAAQGEVLYNDDTTMRILELTGAKAKGRAFVEETPQRKGVFTSGIVSTNDGRQIALFFTGRKHAGENLAEVLARRAKDLAPPIQMCDALSRNVPKELKTLLSNCLAHGRRQFVDVAETFQTECRYVLEILGEVYRNDAIARERTLSPQERLRFHQAESGPLMAKLKAWFTQQFEDRLVEPNSGLGEAISYMLKHWQKLTLFLRKPGAPLDNNICERALKKAILHRKNALFYMSEGGAHVGDLFMSLIHTCQLNEANPLNYLTELQRHAEELSQAPQAWMPWNYRERLKPTDPSRDAAR